MDEPWAAEVLRWWISSAATVAMVKSGGYTGDGPGVDVMRAREAQTIQVIQRIIGGDPKALIVQARATSSSGTVVELGKGVARAKFALGQLNTRAETRERLGTTAPVMSADALHPEVWSPVEQLWGNGHYGEAVQRAATNLNAHVQHLTGRHDQSDAALMAQVFSSSAPEPDKPRLRWPGNDTDLTVRAMRTGILNFSQGCFMAIRNPATHSTEEMPKQLALEQLATLSTLARWIDGCTLVRA